jgi:host factor-I protein
MPKPEINIQDGFLFQVLQSGQTLSIELINGRRIDGALRRFDRFALVIEHDGRERLVYKHAVATIEVAGV